VTPSISSAPPLATRHITSSSISQPPLIDQFTAVRARTERLCRPLAIEDYVVTAMTDASPAKWHLAHTTWFFETFILSKFLPSYRVYDPAFLYLFNSYYVQAGERHCRAQRGLVTRPTVAEVYEYRRAVDDAMYVLLSEYLDDEMTSESESTNTRNDLIALVTIGLNHEQQHQELLLTDLKYLFYANPIRPAYDETPIVGAAPKLNFPEGVDSSYRNGSWIDIPAGLHEFGHDGGGFSFDNEGPRHPRYLAAARIAPYLVTNGEYLQFMLDGGYQRPELWLSAGWAVAQERGWDAPLYWERDESSSLGWHHFTLAGTLPINPDDPVCHMSYYEADAYARWFSTQHSDVRLPTEFEWESAAPLPNDMGDFFYANGDHGARDAHGWYGTVWQWTASPYIGYPGYRPAPGAIGEYNGKFMADQWVLRGSSIATPPGHARRSYRNFFPADTRWQFTGIRLAMDV
jgi:ergothioneine biosynthesis protein EgtB